MVNWISSEDEKDARKIDFCNLYKIIEFAKNNSNDEMVKYVCQIFDEYKYVILENPELLKEIMMKKFGDEFVIDGDIENSDIIISPSDLNAYYTIKELNKNKENLAIVCFDMHSDTYDYNDFLWKGNSFSRLMKEGYINHYIVMGVPYHKRAEVLDETNEDLKSRVHMIDEDALYKTLKGTGCDHVFVSIDADCFNCREAKYTAVEYSPSTILNYVSHIEKINENNLDEKIHECVHVKNELGYSNYYHTGESDLSVERVIEIINNTVEFCKQNNIAVGFTENGPYFQIMEVSGYDYGNLTSEMVIKLIDNLVKKEVKTDEKTRILKKDIKNGRRTSSL